MLNAQTKHSGNFGGKILCELLFPVVNMVGILDLVTSITEAESRALCPFIASGSLNKQFKAASAWKVVENGDVPINQVHGHLLRK
jgi:hypothetical protein